MTDLHEGQELPAQVYRVTRADLVRYAGASGDFNAIHYSDRIARAVGLPGVIAHGMYTMALAGRAVTAWAGRADAMVEFAVRFTRPVVVPDDDAGAEVVVGGAVRTVSPDAGGAKPWVGEQLEVAIDLTVTSGGEKVLAQARATVRLPPR
jgi:acyl dehydratase